LRNIFRLGYSVGLVLTVLFPPLAEAVDLKIGGQIRPRYEMRARDFNNASDPFHFFSTRTRLNVQSEIFEDTEVFIQLQHVRLWGDVDSGLQNNDQDDSLGIHQSYLDLKNVISPNLDFRIGRQEVTLDGGRLVHNNGWTQGALTHDAIRIDKSGQALGGDFTLSYLFLLLDEELDSESIEQDTSFDDKTDFVAHILWVNGRGIIGEKSSTSLYFMFLDDDRGEEGDPFGIARNNEHFITGFRQAGKLFGLDYRVESYYQFGRGDSCRADLRVNLLPPVGDEVVAGGCRQTLITGDPSIGLAVSAGITEVERDAYMFGVRVGKELNLPWKPKITLWYDLLSGDSDAANDRYSAFSLPFDQGHKYYGFLDAFRGVGNGAGNGTSGLGLHDIALKLQLRPSKKWVVRLDGHSFWTHKQAYNFSPSTSTGLGVVGKGSAVNGDQRLGEEIDLTLVYRLNAAVTLSFGYSHFFATLLMSEVGTSVLGGGVNDVSGEPIIIATKGTDDADWAFFMIDARF